ncbi:alpha/beta hydrolase [Magnetospirillum sp. UT-4]|uniref:alpha/beta hydrolase n=1 Tax=Magnetospirillum sp. UT-4 TaxID=2681467 RepID=UPI001381E7B9|nr:alpha/beta fold hydrolase [Magnetospirillum sp. UT-4]CAA7614373.1 Alpha/beta hydrolase fold protein [Magnetospirillum sp. UT-4]
MRKLMLAAIAAVAVLGSGPAAWAADQAVQVKAGGLALNGTLALAGGKAVKDGVVLITHGTLAHNGMEIIKAMQAGLAERGLSSLAITLGLGLDNRSGMYDCAVPHRHKHTDSLDEIGAWLGWLKGQGASKVALLGHSRGGAQTALFAAERPDPVVTKVVLLAPMTYDEKAEAAGYQARYGKPLAGPLAKAAALVKAGKGAEMMTDTGFIYCPGATASAASFVSYYQPDPRLGVVAPLARIKVPTLVIAAANDEVVKGLPEAVAPLADGKRVKLVTVPNADHFFLDLAADDAADAIKAFVAE